MISSRRRGQSRLTANSWNTLPVTVTLVPNASYSLIYNTNGRSSAVNNMRMDVSGYSASAATFGTWPTTFGRAVIGNWNWSIYVTYEGLIGTPVCCLTSS